MAGGTDPVVRFGIGVSDLSKFASDLRRADKEMAKNLRVRLKGAAQIVADRIKEATSWSSKIPGSVRTISTARSAAVRVGGKRAPNAAPINNRDQSGDFRHPVFGKGGWATQPAHPFALKSLADTADEVEVEVGRILDQFADDAGFR